MANTKTDIDYLVFSKTDFLRFSDGEIVIYNDKEEAQIDCFVGDRLLTMTYYFPNLNIPSLRTCVITNEEGTLVHCFSYDDKMVDVRSGLIEWVLTDDINSCI